MTDIQLKSLPRARMLEILYQQEKEIETLNTELSHKESTMQTPPPVKVQVIEPIKAEVPVQTVAPALDEPVAPVAVVATVPQDTPAKAVSPAQDGASELFNRIIKSAQDAAEDYYKELKNAEEEKKRELESLKFEIQRLDRETESRREEAAAAARKIFDMMDETFQWHINGLNSIYKEFQNMVRAASNSQEQPTNG